MNEHMPLVVITTDGSARGNPGPGGWAALLEAGPGREHFLTGEQPHATTNNAMEVAAVLHALQALKQPCQVHLRTDSEYVLNGIRRILKGGTMAGTKFNRELWQQLEQAIQRHQIDLEWVRGHAGDPRNERVDRAANAAANSAARQATPSNQVGTGAADWIIGVRTAPSGGGALWVLQTPDQVRFGAERRGHETDLTNLYHALVSALDAALVLLGRESSAPPVVRIVSNVETLIKQGRGEWKVKQPPQQPLARRVQELALRFGAVSFDYVPTAELQQLFQPVSASQV